MECGKHNRSFTEYEANVFPNPTEDLLNIRTNALLMLYESSYLGIKPGNNFQNK